MSLLSPEPSPDGEQTHHAPELERRYLRRGVEGMAAQRSGCSRCGRSPLVGERLSVFRAQSGERRYCDTCMAQMPLDDLGDPLRIERVHASERRLRISRAA
jgi:hypothetical protein